MPRTIGGAVLVCGLTAALGGSGCIDNLIRSFIPVSPADAEPGFIDGGPGRYDGIIPDKLSVNGASPSHGTFMGGTEVVVTGSGFTKDAKVRIGGKEIQVGGTTVLSPLAVRVVTPAGEVGPADVEVTVGGETVVLTGGYTYDPLHLDPESGPASGGTLVKILGKGTAFVAGTTVLFSGKPMSELEVVSATTLRGRTPPGPTGPADVTITTPGTPETKTTIKDAFLYYSSVNPKSGGMGGGPLAGTLTVAVLNWLNRKPVPGAQVIVQKQRELTLQKNTDGKGMAVFTDSRLQGIISVTAGTPGYESSTLVDFDARDVTIFLMPIPKPQPGPMPPGPLPGAVKGNVLFGGPTGVGSSEWKLVPAPKAGQVKRCYVFVTTPAVEWGPATPSSTATIDFTGQGETAWPYTLTVNNGNMAAYAVAGLYTAATQSFEPYAMGVTRGVVVGPGETKSADVWVTMPLSEKVTVKVKGVPPEMGRYTVRLGISLGADGVILRQDMEESGDGLFESKIFARLPAFSNPALVDATYAVEVDLDSGAASGTPAAHATERSILPAAGSGTITIADFVGVPKQVKPAAGAALEGNTLMWSQAGSPASLAVTLIQLSDGTPVWRIISQGDVTQVKLPDPATLGLPAWPSGPLLWLQWLAHLPAFNFDTYNYTHLSSTYWDRWSFDQFTIKVP